MWFRAAWDLTTRPNGQSARNLQRNLGLGSYQTAWTMLHRYRRAMVAPGRTRLSGVVELDETVVGGKNKPGKRGRAKDANRHIVGECFWGFELHGVVPDIVTMGKPLGNGHPLAAVVTTPAVAASFHNGMEYFNTFGGNPVSATIGQAVLDYVLDMRLQAHARDVGAYLQSGVRDLMTESPLITDVRGHGLFLGIELQRDGIPATTEVADLIEFAKARGVMLSSDGPANNVFKIKPPMVIQREDVDLFLEVFRDGLREVNR